MTKSESAIRNPRSLIALLLFLAAVLAVYFSGLTMPLVGPDEPRYAQVAREMFERGDWITPTLGGYNWFEKPALLYWLQIGSYNIFGVSEFSARFGSALFGLGTIASLWILGRHVEPSGDSSKIGFANCLALIAASTIGIIAFAHGASFDIILTFPITAALVSYFIYDLRQNTAWLVSFYFFVGLALLAKGLVGIVFPFAIVSFYLLFSRKLPSRGFVLSLLWGTALSVAVASLWYLPMYLRHGYEFIDQFFIQHHFQRYTSNKYLHPQPFYFFFWVLPLMTIPWLPLFLASIWRWSRRIVDKTRGAEGSAIEASPARRQLVLLAIAWMAVPLAFFSFSGSKLPGYILPAVPAALILTADYTIDFARKGATRAYLVQAIAAATLVCVLIATLLVAPRIADTDSVRSLFETARERGLNDLPVMVLHGISHNAEFYASGRVLRDVDGKQRKFMGMSEVLAEMRARGQDRALVLVTNRYLREVMQSESIRAELLKTNGEWNLTVINYDYR